MKVSARDVFGELLPVSYTAELERVGRSPRSGRQRARDIPPRGCAEFAASSARTYSLTVSADAHRPVRKIIRGTQGEVAVVLPILPAAVIGYEWPMHREPILNVELESILEPQRRGALLNIWAKLWAVFLGAIPAGAYVDSILEVKVDRLLCRVSAAIMPAIAGADELDVVMSSLHPAPAGHTNGISVKTLESHGNLQITIFEPADHHAPYLADIDIDESSGLEHLFDVIEHHATGSRTDQIDVHQILVSAGIDPGWRPLVV